MKFSQFNSIIPYEEQFALYNSYNQKVLFMVPELKVLLDKHISSEIDRLKDIHPSFYEYLLEEEFIIDENTDEIKKVKDLSKEIDNNINEFLLTINPTMDCNFKCWYCYEKHIKQSKLSDETVDRIKKLIVSIINNKELNLFTLSFFGGEPLLYFKKSVIPIIDFFIKENVQRKLPANISFTTNGYLINNDFIEYFKKNKINCSCQITLDGCREDHDLIRYIGKNKGTYDKIIENILLLVKNKYFVRLRINYTNENIHKAYKIVDDLKGLSKLMKTKYLMIDFHRVWQNDELDDTNLLLEDNLIKIREKGFTVMGSYSPNNVRESCYADKINSVIINYNGDIYKCTARDFDKENKAGYIDESGKLIWENNYIENRMNSKYNFSNNPCNNCKILPLCNGGCSQHISEWDGKDFCVYHNDENEINKVVKTKITEITLNAAKK